VGAQTLQQQAGLLHGRQLVLLVTIGLHALFIAVLMTMKMGVPDILKPLVTRAEFLAPEVEVEKPPPTLQVEKPATPVISLDIPVPRIDIPIEDIPPTALVLPAADIGAATDVVTGPPSGSTVEIASTALQFTVVRPTDDYYPSQSLSLQEQGMAVVRVCVTPAGRLDGRPVIEATSGSSRLDAAAILWAREALRFKPATRDGVAVAACKGFRVNFRLN
jgi:periplasmic protein TonB